MRGQGRLFRRKNSTSWWIAYFHRGKEIRESAKTTNEQKAGRLLRERLRTAGTQEFIGPTAQRVTFDDLATLYLTDYRLNGRRSLRDATRNVETLREAFGIDRALDITADRIAAYTARRLEAGLKPASVNRELAALRRMFTLAIRAGKIATRPHIALPRRGQRPRRVPRARRLRLAGGPPGRLARGRGDLRLSHRVAEGRGGDTHLGRRGSPQRGHPPAGGPQQE